MQRGVLRFFIHSERSIHRLLLGLIEQEEYFFVLCPKLKDKGINV